VLLEGYKPLKNNQALRKNKKLQKKFHKGEFFTRISGFLTRFLYKVHTGFTASSSATCYPVAI